MSEEKTTNQGVEFVITRVFSAPRELVFKAWTEAEHLQHWWGPTGFSIHISKADIHPGGIFHFCMKSSDGHEMWAKFVYGEIVAPEKLVYITSFSDEEGNTVRASFSETFPLEISYVVTFIEKDGKTRIEMSGGPVDATEEELQFYHSMFGSMQQGFGATFGQLDEYLASL
ncbi:SRPBCC family protein [Paenibacillus agricola]|uniref:SRPBCC domain-containing protein n=1 Tax=Paenibacillus agricola TaxID=2716264 RepID=A0ABX0J5K3_9BACL|nr:SRPBCC domain-containing protein [Paenibacillus agricola]NHN30439.1 SRPBCC domain-containing protein [Paenibacillus agricola]